VETQISCPLSNAQLNLYKTILQKDLGMLEKICGSCDLQSGGEVVSKSRGQQLNNILMQVRVCVRESRATEPTCELPCGWGNDQLQPSTRSAAQLTIHPRARAARAA
jgi:hypothetical protein